MTVKLLVAACAAMLIAGCASRSGPDARRPSGPPPVVVEPRPPILPTPAEYVERAAAVDLFIVQASELILQRSTQASIRSLASSVADAHRGLAGQLSFAGRRLNILPSAGLTENYRLRIEALRASTNLESDYRAMVGGEQRRVLRLHSDYARAGSSPTLRPVAANAARRIRELIAQAGW